ncbi:MAG: VWA domain-containing protein [Chitinophagales bacterium]|nr:VWA domain-containing protein [Chitinophagales bacterium]
MKNFLTLLLSLFLLQNAAQAGGFVVSACKDCYWYPNDKPSMYGEPFPDDFDPFFVSLTSETAKVDIADGKAKVEIVQTFYNPLGDTIPSYFLFPVPQGTTLNDFTIMVGEDKYRAEKYSPAQSLIVFQELVKRTKKPDYWQYANGETYRMLIYKTLPRQTVKLTITYTQNLHKKDNVYSFNYPLNTQHFYKSPIKETNVAINVQENQAISNYLSNTSLNLSQKNVNANQISVNYSGKTATTKATDDVAFSYQVGEVAITEGLSLVTYKKPNEDGYFMLSYDGGKKTPANRDVLFLIDASSNMSGDKLAKAKKAIQGCLAKLASNDRFNIMAFNDAPKPAFDAFQANNATNIGAANTFLGSLTASGGSNVQMALKAVLAINPDKIRPFHTLFFCGGNPNVGLDDGEDLADMVTKANMKTLRIYPVGMGNTVDVTLYDQIAAATLGYSTYVLPDEDTDALVGNLFATTGSVVLTNLQLYFSGAFEIKDQFPRKPDAVYTNAPFVMIGRYKRPGDYDISLIGDYNDQMNRFNLRGKFPSDDQRFPYVAKLWAVRMVGNHCNDIRINGKDDDITEDLGDLAENFMLTTPYTNSIVKKNQSYLSDAEKTLLPQFYNTATQLYGDHLPYLDKAAGDQAIIANREVWTMLNISKTEQLINPSNSKATGNAKIADDLKTLPSGRTLYKTVGGLWADFEILDKLKTTSKRIAFYSPDYFNVMSKHPDIAADFLYTSRDKLTFITDDTRYEIYEDKELLKTPEKKK